MSVDCGLHVVPAVALTLDLLLFSPPWTVKWTQALAISTVIAFAYWAWIETCYGHNGFYPYPIFEMLGRNERVGLFGGSAVMMAAVTMGLGSVYAIVNKGTRIAEGGIRKNE
jgi:hypothetical protein